MVRRGRDRVESRKRGGFSPRTPRARSAERVRERARSPGTLATRAARGLRTGSPRAAAARPPSPSPDPLDTVPRAAPPLDTR